MVKLIRVLTACTIATAVMCWLVISFSQMLDPFWGLFLFPFGVFGILFTVNCVLLHE